MQYTIQEYDKSKVTVDVRFHNEFGYHDREVNVCLTLDNEYDKEATEDRVKEVLRAYPHLVATGSVILTPHEEVTKSAPTEEVVVETKPKKSKKK